jgi:lipid II:glycine glycyltransferase (peptidoglycan interpeptide bridge formation enzyme)
MGWSGYHEIRQPNEVLLWKVIMWAKLQGYRYFDFDGIDPSVAKALVHGEQLHDSLRQTPTSFKLGFGGKVLLFPGAYDYVYNSFLRWAYNSVLPMIATWPVTAKTLNRLRTR